MSLITAEYTPRCFPDRRSYVVWLQAAHYTGGCFDAGICTDCTAEYQARMLAERRCTQPNMRFAEDEDGFTQGVI